jgi:uncharacterized protein
MKSKYSFILGCLLIFIVCNCKPTQKASQPVSNNNSLLWKITGNGLASPSYLFGTIHIIPSKDYFLPEGTLAALDQSKSIFFEIDMKDMSDMSKIMPLMGKMFMKDGKTLEDLLSKEEYTKVEKYFETMGLPFAFLNKVKPMFLSALTMGGDLKGNGADSKIKSYEMEFFELAESKKLQTGGLESIEYQLNIFDEIPYEEQAKMLVEGINEGGEEDKDFLKMIQTYKNQDIEGLLNMMAVEGKDIMKHEDVLINKRNADWIPKIRTQSSKTPTFYAVGAGHLGGKNGVISLLKKAGYRVDPISQKK